MSQWSSTWTVGEISLPPVASRTWAAPSASSRNRTERWGTRCHVRAARSLMPNGHPGLKYTIGSVMTLSCPIHHIVTMINIVIL